MFRGSFCLWTFHTGSLEFIKFPEQIRQQINASVYHWSGSEQFAAEIPQKNTLETINTCNDISAITPVNNKE